MLKTYLLSLYVGIWVVFQMGMKTQAHGLDSLRQVLDQYQEASEFSDSQMLLDLHLQIGKAYMAERKFDSALMVFQKGIPLSQDPISLATLYYEMGYCYQVESNYPKAIKYNQMASETISEEVPLQLRVGIHHQLAQLYVNQSRLDTALVIEFRGLLLAEESRDSLSLSKVYGGLARIYHYAEFKEKALTYDLKAMRIKSKIGKPMDRYRGYVDVASSYLELSQLDSTLRYAHLAQGQARQMEFGHGVAFSSLLLGEAYKRMDSLDLARNMLDQSRSDFRELGRLWPIADALSSYGDVLELMNKPQAAIDTLLSALELAEHLKNHDLRIDISNKLSHLYQQVGKQNKSQEFAAEFGRLTAKYQAEKGDSLRILGMKFQIAEAETKSLEERALYERRILEKEQKIRIQGLRQTILALGLLGVIFLLAFVHSKYRISKERNQYLTREKEETLWSIQHKAHLSKDWKQLSDRIYGEIHERLKALWQSLYAEGVEQGVPVFTGLSPKFSSLYQEIRSIDGSLTQLRYFMNVGITEENYENLENLTMKELLSESQRLLDTEQRERLQVSPYEMKSFKGDRQKFVLLLQQLQLFILESVSADSVDIQIRNSFDKEAGSYDMDYLLSFEISKAQSINLDLESWHLDICRLIIKPYGGKLWIEEKGSSGFVVHMSYPWDKVKHG